MLLWHPAGGQVSKVNQVNDWQMLVWTYFTKTLDTPQRTSNNFIKVCITHAREQVNMNTPHVVQCWGCYVRQSPMSLFILIQLMFSIMLHMKIQPSLCPWCNLVSSYYYKLSPLCKPVFCCPQELHITLLDTGHLGNVRLSLLLALLITVNPS